MESSSTIYVSPSFDRHSSNDIADIADRVVQELLAENGLHGDDLFSFSDEDTPPNIDDDNIEQINTDTRTEIVKRIQEDDPDEDGPEFEFPVVCNSSPVEIVSEEHISPRYPLFDTSLLSEIDINSSNDTDVGGSDSRSPPAPTTRSSLRKLFSEDRDSVSCSSSEADDLDGITPGTYCVWKPKTEPQPRGKHKKSNSVSIDLNTSKRWKVRDLLKRSYSDDNYTTTTTAGKEAPVVLFLPPISPNRKTNNEKVKKIEKIGCSVGCGGGVTSAKIERQTPAYKSKIGNIRLPPYLPYRQDQVGVFAANFNGSSKNLYRY